MCNIRQTFEPKGIHLLQYLAGYDWVFASTWKTLMLWTDQPVLMVIQWILE
jgi:hypothetical protein